MSERTYSDDEVRKIFDLATQPQTEAGLPSNRDGLTLSQIRSVALEAGIDPEAIARAAAALEVSDRHAPRASLGMPIEVGRVVPLSRHPTDEEWAQLVSELRTTFRAQGKVVQYGAFREWSNGNLHAAIETTEGGHRLRLGTLKSGARDINVLGALGLAAGAVLFGATALASAPISLAAPVILTGSGTTALLWNLVRLPRWARLRERQMAHIEAKALQVMRDKPRQ